MDSCYCSSLSMELLMHCSWNLNAAGSVIYFLRTFRSFVSLRCLIISFLLKCLFFWVNPHFPDTPKSAKYHIYIYDTYNNTCIYIHILTYCSLYYSINKLMKTKFFYTLRPCLIPRPTLRIACPSSRCHGGDGRCRLPSE